MVSTLMDNSSITHPRSGKYERAGAYHWAEANPRWGNLSYNVPLVARYRAILDRVPPTGGIILDVGCGDGYLMHLLHRHGFSYLIGLDNDPLGVGLAEDKLREHGDAAACHVGVASAYNLPLPPSCVDAVIMADVIEHLDTPEKAVEEASRVLTKSGALILSTPNWQPDLAWDASHVQEFRPEELESMLARLFRQVTIYGCWPMWCFRLWSRSVAWRQLLRCLARLGMNLFAMSAEEAWGAYGQLIAVCSK